MPRGTPSHTITQTMLAKHQYRFFCRSLFISRSNIAADIMKIAMIDVHKELKKRNMKSRMILKVHDELLLEAECSEVDEVKEILRDKMDNAVKLSVPLIVDMHTGKNWYEAK